jgi:hypothetical protein
MSTSYCLAVVRLSFLYPGTLPPVVPGSRPGFPDKRKALMAMASSITTAMAQPVVRQVLV